MDKIIKIKKKDGRIQDGRCSSGLYQKNVWMPPVHTEHKESMLCQTKGMSICSIHLDANVHKQHKESILCPTKGVSLCPYTFGCPLYV